VTEAAFACMNLNMSLIALDKLQTLPTYQALFPTSIKRNKMLNLNIFKFEMQRPVFGPAAATKATFAMWSGCIPGVPSAALCFPTDVNKTENWVDVLDATKVASLRCLVLTVKAAKTGLGHANCEEKRPFPCEVDI